MARFTIPRDIYHGKGALEALKTLQGKRAMLCVGGGSMKRFGFLDRAVDYLKEAGMMNAGAYGGEMKDVVLSVLSADETGELRERRLEECGFSYRHSVFETKNSIILSVKLKLSPGDPDAIRARMEELSARRRAKQPLNLPSAGSTFKRPAGGYAAAMLEGAGMKGRGVGGACISEKHAGFVVSRGDATFDDVLATMEMAKKAVFDKYGVWLEPEVRIIR